MESKPISVKILQNGVEFSGGEGQKLAMARALYKNAPIIILDDLTSALDPIAENKIYLKFNNLTEDKSTIYISHLLSNCQFCDKIIALDHGEFVQYGIHKEFVFADELYVKCGVCRRHIIRSNEKMLQIHFDIFISFIKIYGFEK